MPTMHVVELSMHLRRRQQRNGDVEIVSKVGNCLHKVILDIGQPFVDGHLQVTAESSNELFEIKANVLIGKI